MQALETQVVMWKTSQFMTWALLVPRGKSEPAAVFPTNGKAGRIQYEEVGFARSTNSILVKTAAIHTHMAASWAMPPCLVD